jgi:hypothetical protein
VNPRALAIAGIAADADAMTETEVYFDTPEWTALMDWLEFHGIDPHRIPAGSRVSRDACNRCIRYVAIVVDHAGKPVPVPDPVTRRWVFETLPAVEQGEAAPLPYPDLIARQLR